MRAASASEAEGRETDQASFQIDDFFTEEFNAQRAEQELQQTLQRRKRTSGRAKGEAPRVHRRGSPLGEVHCVEVAGCFGTTRGPGWVARMRSLAIAWPRPGVIEGTLYVDDEDEGSSDASWHEEPEP